MSSSVPPFDVVVVGAGLSGLLAARALQTRGLQPLVLDKARGVGGRMASRRIGNHVADHGAQFFTAYDPVFRRWVEEWEGAGVVRPWSTGFTTPDGSFKDNGVVRYCGTTGMSSITKHLARGLDVRVQSKVVRVQAEGGAWIVVTEDGGIHPGRALLLTPPVPQSLDLLAAGEVPLPGPLAAELEQIDYAPCLTVLARLAGSSLIPEPGGVWGSGEPLLWIADNRRKGVSSAPGTIVTIHAGPEFSRAHWEGSETEVTASILSAAAPWLGSAPEETQLQRWRYSVPLRVHPDPCLILHEPAPLGFAGDAFGGPRVEAAALSGLAAGAALGDLLNRSATPGTPVSVRG